METDSTLYNLEFLLQIFLTIFQLLYLLVKMLDLVNLKNTNYEFRKLDTAATDRINTLLLGRDWSPLQPLHINDQFDFVNNTLLEYINICAPIKVAKIPAKYVVCENLMTKGLLQFSINLHKLRKKETGQANSKKYI